MVIWWQIRGALIAPLAGMCVSDPLFERKQGMGIPVNWYDRYIEKIPGVQGGEPVIAGTRTPVRAIAELFYSVYPGDMKELRRALSHLDNTQIEAGLDYYRDHQAEIDGHMARHREALIQVRDAPAFPATDWGEHGGTPLRMHAPA